MKNILLALLAITALSLATPAVGQDKKQGEKEAKWAPRKEKEVQGVGDWRAFQVTDASTDETTINYRHRSKLCFVDVLPKAGGLRTTAYDYGFPGGSLVQIIEFKGTAENRSIKEDRSISGEGAYEQFGARRGYDVFYVKCLEDAKKFPKEIRALFLGYWDMPKD